MICLLHLSYFCEENWSSDDLRQKEGFYLVYIFIEVRTEYMRKHLCETELRELQVKTDCTFKIQ